MYPDQLDGWQMVSPSKLGSWFLLMIISVVLVTWVYPPRDPERLAGGDDEGRMPQHPPLEKKAQTPVAGA